MEQITIFDYLESQKIQKPQKFEWMSDDWHLCSEETPPEDGVYYTFIIFEGSYIYGYKAYSGGFWWCWQDYKWVKKKDLVVAGWSIISSEMKATDKCLPERLTLRGILG